MSAPRGRVLETEVAIIGAGFSGLGAAIGLRQRGIEDFVVLERGDELGGTWRDNTYPGCQCDIPAHLYSLASAPSTSWSRTYPLQSEIHAYMDACARRFRVHQHLRLRQEVKELGWKERERCWRIRADSLLVRASFVVVAVGGFAEPRLPAIEGIDDFCGPVFHSSRWRHDVALEGRSVAVVGTGASAIQLVPEIQPKVERLTVLQRTPPWVIPHVDRPVGALERSLYRRFGASRRLRRAGSYWGRELVTPALTRAPRTLTLVERLARAHLRRQVPDPQLRRQLTPDYRIGCKRILLSNRWYPALSADNVAVVSEALAAVKRNSVICADGSEHAADAIIFATGFQSTEWPFAERVIGACGQSLAETWAGGMRAYKGVAVKGFPNLFLVPGPNTTVAHTSHLFMIECQVDYALEAIKAARSTGVVRLEVKAAAEAAWSRAVQRKLEPTVWNTGGCASWYLDASGTNTTLWPDYTWRFRRQTRRFDPANYIAVPSSGASASAVESSRRGQELAQEAAA